MKCEKDAEGVAKGTPGLELTNAPSTFYQTPRPHSRPGRLAVMAPPVEVDRAVNSRIFVQYQLARGNLLAAEMALEEVLKLNPGDSDAHAHLAMVKLQQGFNEDARRCVNRALQLGPNHAYVHCVQSHVRL